MLEQACPCGRRDAKGKPLPFSSCCGPYLTSPPDSWPPDAQALMRSRYSAFVLGLTDYLLDSWHPSTRPPTLELEPDIKWLGLEVRAQARQGEDHATVEFVARSRVVGRGQRLHERSRFVRENGRWYYVDGDLF